MAQRDRRRIRFQRRVPDFADGIAQGKSIVPTETGLSLFGVPSQLDWLISMTAMIVLFWSRARVSVIEPYLALTISGPPAIPASIPAGGPSIGSGSKCDAVRHYALPRFFVQRHKVPTLAHPKSSASDPIGPKKDTALKRCCAESAEAQAAESDL